MELKYHLLLPLMDKEFDDTNLSFTINHIRSRTPSVLYFILHCFDRNGNELYITDDTLSTSTITIDRLNNKEDTENYNPYTFTLEEDIVSYVSPRKAIGTVFSSEGVDYTQNFDLDERIVSQTVYVQLEIISMGTNSENPLYFSELMFQEKAFSNYHTPSELKNRHSIEFLEANYVNCYSKEGDYLQIIRPNREGLTTAELTTAKYSILAPHFKEDKGVDSPVSVFIEAMNQTEQTIDVLR